MSMTIHRRNLIAGTGGIALAATLGGRRRALAQTAGPIRIPYILPLSGPLALLGGPIQMGAQITMEMINKSGGINGRPIEVIFRDDKLQPQESIAATREMVGAGYNIVCGGMTGPTALAMMDVVKEAKAILLTTATGMPVTHELYSRYVFRAQDNEYQRLRAQARLAADRFADVKMWGAVINDTLTYKTSYASFCKLVASYLTAQGKPVPKFAEPILAKMGGTDFRPLISQASAQGVDGIYHILAGSDSVTFWQQARGFGLTKSITAVMDQTMDIPAGKALRANLPPNLWSVSAWNPAIYKDNPLSKALYDGFVDRTKDANPSGYLMFPHIPLLGIAAALRAAGGATDTETVIKAMEGLRFETAKGPAEFRREDHQVIVDTCFINMVGQEQEPGFSVANAYRIGGAELVEPASPGVAFDL